jgi:hypothetical protein
VFPASDFVTRFQRTVITNLRRKNDLAVSTGVEEEDVLENRKTTAVSTEKAETETDSGIDMENVTDCCDIYVKEVNDRLHCHKFC